jgi:hypothetical protein
MHYSTTIFGQLLAFIPKDQLRKFTGQHKAERYAKKITVWNHLVVLLYAQAAGKDSLREIEKSFIVGHETWHHLGIKSVSRSSISRVNNTRDPAVFEKLFYALLTECQSITSSRKFSFENPLYSLDATLVNLCLNLFDWAKYRTGKGAVKIHTVLNNRTGIPTVIEITPGNVADIKQGKKLKLDFPAQSILVFDRGYVDYAWWKELDTKGIFWVTRTKENMVVIVSKRHPVVGEGILSDDTIWLGDPLKDAYGKEMRRVLYKDEKQGVLVFITNNFDLSASEIALVYKDRWQVELFFKWIKQNLKIKTFLGTSKNAVMNQIWAVMIYYLLLSYIKFQTRYEGSLLEFTWMINSTLLSRRSLIDLLSLTPKTITALREREAEESPQIPLF